MSTSPKRIYIESTALFQLGPRFENVDFEKLLELRASAGFQVLVSEVSWLEYLRKRKKEVTDFLGSCSKAQRMLEKHGKLIPEIASAHTRVSEYLSGIDDHYRARAKLRGIEIVPLAPVMMERLLEMSIECTAPFEEAEDMSKEKGFRDSLIMFSILESLRSQASESAIVVTNDSLLAKAFELHAKDYNANVVVIPTLDEATAYISETIAGSERQRLKEESAKAIEMLKNYNEDIAASIDQIRELSESELGQGLLTATLAPKEYQDIRGVKSVSFVAVDSAIWKDKDKQTSRILFRSLCKAIVLIAAPYLRPILGTERRFEVGERASSTLYFNTSTSEPTEQKELQLHFYGTAEFERSGSDWRLTRMRIEKSLPSEEEYYALVDAALSQAGTGTRSSNKSGQLGTNKAPAV